MCSRLLKALVIASEKAANVARLIRQDEHLFELLVQEKTGDSANARFVRDFKTLADVLIQEMVRHDISTLVSVPIHTFAHVIVIDFLEWFFNFTRMTDVTLYYYYPVPRAEREHPRRGGEHVHKCPGRQHNCCNPVRRICHC